MTRKEEIEKASVDYQMSKHPMAIGGDAFADTIYKVNTNPSFIAGAEWADQHQKGLWDSEKFIDKACEWLEPVFKNLAGYNCGGDLINDFRRAMEE